MYLKRKATKKHAKGNSRRPHLTPCTQSEEYCLLILFAIRTEDAGYEEIQIFLKIDKELPNQISAENLFQSPVLLDGDG